MLLFANPPRQRFRRFRGVFPSRQNSPYTRITRSLYCLTRAVRRQHVLLNPFGIRALAVRAHLHGEQRRLRIGRRRDHRQLHLCDSGPDQFDLLRGRVREIDDTVVDERASVDNPDIHGLIVRHVTYPHPRLEWQCAMRSHQGFHVVYLPIGRLPSMIRMSIPTRRAALRLSGYGGRGRLAGRGPGCGWGGRRRHHDPFLPAAIEDNQYQQGAQHAPIRRL